MKETKRLNINIKRDTYLRLRSISEMKDKRLRDIVEPLIEQYVEKEMKNIHRM